MAARIKDNVGERATSPPAVPPRAAPGSAWPGALRIDVELAENHARRMAPAMQVTGGIGQLGGRRKVASPSASATVKNDLRLNNHAEITSRRQDDDKNETGKKGELIAESRLIPESAPLRRSSGRGSDRQKSDHGGVATRSTGQKKQQEKQLSDSMSKKQRHAAGWGVGGKGVDSPCDARISTISKEARKGEHSATSESKSNCDGKGAATYASTRSTTEKDNSSCGSAAGATGTAAAAAAAAAAATAAVTSLEMTEQPGGMPSRASSAVEDGRGDEVRVDGRRATGLLNEAKDGGGRARISCQLHSAAGTDVKEARRRHPPQPPVPMGQVAMLIHQVGLGMQMVVAVTSAASKGQGGDQVRSIITATDPEAPPPPSATRAPCSPVTVGRVAHHPVERKTPSPTCPDTDAASLDLRERFVEVRGRCRSSLKTLRAASAAVAVPGERLRRSFEAYCHAHGSLQRIEASIRCAEEQETIAVAKLRRASEAVVMAQTELSRAGMASCDGNGVNSVDNTYPSFCPPSVSNSGSTNKSNGEHSDDDDGNNNGKGSPARPSASPAMAATRPPAEGEAAEIPRHDKRNENTEPKTKARGEIEGESKRPRLLLALETARGVAEQALAEKRRAEAEADSALILVGALTAGDWTLAVEACDTARAVYGKVAEETVPKLQEFRDGVRLFQHLSNVMMDARRKLDLSLQVGQASSRNGGGRGTGYDEQDVSTTNNGDGNGSGTS